METQQDLSSLSHINMERHSFSSSLRAIASGIVTGAALLGSGEFSRANARANLSEDKIEEKSKAEDIGNIIRKLGNVEKGLKVLKYGLKVSGGENLSAEMEGSIKVIQKLEKTASTLKKGAEKVKELAEGEEEDVEKANKLLSPLKVGMKTLAGDLTVITKQLEILTRIVDKYECGLVTTVTRPDLLITPEIARSPRAVKEKLTEYVEAKSRNVAALEKADEILSDTSVIGRRGARLLNDYADVLIDLQKIGAGAFLGSTLPLKALDLMDMATKMNGLSNVCEKKLEEVRKIKKEEKKLLKTLKFNLDQF